MTMYILVDNNQYVREVIPGIDFTLDNIPANVVSVRIIEPTHSIFDHVERLDPSYNPETQEWTVSYSVTPLTGAAFETAVKVYNASVSDAIQRLLDNAARDREYDNILSLCSYLDSSIPLFAAEAQVAKQWRDDIWGYCEAVRMQVLSGQRPAPTVEQLMTELPVPNWPERG